MDDEPRFAADLYRGTAGYYDQYRLPYPQVMITDPVRRAEVSEAGRLLDLACGTGQFTFPLRRWFGEVWAVDAEPDMVEVVRAKAAAGGAGDVRPIVSRAESLGAEPDYFELAVIGNAFHRLDRDLVADRRGLRLITRPGIVVDADDISLHGGGVESPRHRRLTRCQVPMGRPANRLPRRVERALPDTGRPLNHGGDPGSGPGLHPLRERRPRAGGEG